MNIIATVTGSIILLESKEKEMRYCKDEIRLNNGIVVQSITETIKTPAEIHNKELWVRPYINGISIINIHTMFVRQYNDINTVVFPEGVETIDEPSLKQGKLSKVIIPYSYKFNSARAFSDIKEIEFNKRDSYLNIPSKFMEDLFEFGVSKLIFEKQVIERR